MLVRGFYPNELLQNISRLLFSSTVAPCFHVLIVVTWTWVEVSPALISSITVLSRGYSTRCWWQTPGDDTWTPAEEEGCCWPAAATAAVPETQPLDSVGGIKWKRSITEMFAQLQYNNTVNHIKIRTHCFSSLGVQKDQNKAVRELLVQNSLKQDDTHGYRWNGLFKKLLTWYSSLWC